MHRQRALSSLAFGLVLLTLAALAALATLGCSRRDAEPAQETEFRIGMIAPISAPVRFTGPRLLQTRVAELNAKGGLEVGGRMLRVRLIVADSGTRVEQAMPDLLEPLS